MGGITKGGYGQQGYCKLCSFSDPQIQDDFDRRTGKMKPGKTVEDPSPYAYSPKALNEWLAERDIESVDRATIYRHRGHVMHPKDRMVTAVAKRDAEGRVQAPTVTEDAFLQSVVNVGAKKVQDNPEEVTIDQALKAAQIRANMQKKGTDLNMLVAIFTEGSTEPIIEGEAVEL